MTSRRAFQQWGFAIIREQLGPPWKLWSGKRSSQNVWGPLALYAAQPELGTIDARSAVGLLLQLKIFWHVKQKGTGAHIPYVAQVHPDLCSQLTHRVCSTLTCTAVVFISASSASYFSQSHPVFSHSKCSCLSLCLCSQPHDLVILPCLLRLGVLLTYQLLSAIPANKYRLLSHVHLRSASITRPR